MSLLVVGLFFLHVPLAMSANPAVNFTALDTTIAPAWVNGPGGRGTWSILYSCLFTLVLCVYTAVHMNVPGRKETPYMFWKRKVKWVTIAIFAPEIVVYVAFQQWYLARKFRNELREITKECPDEKFQAWYKSQVKANPFDMVYSHYVVMGGFAVDVRDIHNKFEVVTLSPDGVLYLARHGYFCKVQESDIEDKSKADTFAKAIVCVQVLWIVGQAIERKATGYPLTLLEIHTIVHAACALVMYGLWIQKPLNIGAPTIIELGEDKDLIAFGLELLGEKLRGGQYVTRLNGLTLVSIADRPKFLWYSNPEPLFKGPTQSDMLETTDRISSSFREGENGVPLLTQYWKLHEDEEGRPTSAPIGKIGGNYEATEYNVACTLRSGQTLPSKLGPGFRIELIDGLERGNVCPDSGQELGAYTISLSAKDLRRLELVDTFLRRIQHKIDPERSFPKINQPRFLEHVPHGECYLDPKYPAYRLDNFDHKCSPKATSFRMENFQDTFLNTLNKGNAYLAAVLALLPTAYGCIHIAALTVIFPTKTERLLWKISCYDLIVSTGVLVVLFLLLYTDNSIFEAYTKFQHKKADRRPSLPDENPASSPRLKPPLTRALSSGMKALESDKNASTTLAVCLFMIFSSCFVLLYMISRLFIVVESFISLRHVPVGVYQTPTLNIMNNFPHL